MTAIGFTQAYLMAGKSQTHEALSLFHQRGEVPDVMVMDGSKEQLLGQIFTQLPTGWIAHYKN